MNQIDIFEKHTQKANEWLRHIGDRAGCNDNRKSLAALRATLHRLRDNLPVETVLHLGAQLPLIIKGILFENWHLSDYPSKDRKINQFIDGIEEEFYHTDLDTEIWTCAVFQVLSSRISLGEVEKIRKALPGEIAILWEEVSA